jgi:ligand-binding sensor protein
MGNHVKIKKVHLNTFIEILVGLYDKGVNYVDIIGTMDDEQDSVGISFSKEYMDDEYKDNFDNIPEVDGDKLNLSDDDLNQLI